jgi:hypothetical protein
MAPVNTVRLLTCSLSQTDPVFRNIVTTLCIVVFMQHFLIRICIAKCFTNSSKPFRCEVVFENEHVLLAKTPCSYLHSVCATGMSSGLATDDLDLSVTGDWECLLHEDEPASDFIVVPWYVT